MDQMKAKQRMLSTWASTDPRLAGNMKSIPDDPLSSVMVILNVASSCSDTTLPARDIALPHRELGTLPPHRELATLPTLPLTLLARD